MDSPVPGAQRALQRTLLEQMEITEFEIRQRKELFGVSREVEERLFTQFATIKHNLESIITRFYAEQTAVKDIAVRIGDSDTLARLQAGMRGYVLDLFSGSYDIEYVKSGLRIGVVHKRIGVSPKLYLAGVNTLSKILRQQLRELSNRQDADFSQDLHAIRNILWFDVSYVMDTYIRSLMIEVETGRREMEEYAESLEQKIAERTEELKAASRIDNLTKLYNQRSFYDHLRVALANAARVRDPLCLVYLDIDGFKTVNDEDGHQAGDAILSTLGDAIRNSIREMDIGCRYGGDEFCVILPPRATTVQAEVVCERIQERIAVAEPKVSLSIGVAQAGPRRFVDGSELVRQADALMYQAKRSGPGFIQTAILEEMLPAEGADDADAGVSHGPRLVSRQDAERA